MTTLDKHTIDKIFEFCEYHDIPNFVGALQMYESFYNQFIPKIPDKKEAEAKIWDEWMQVYKAYWDKDLRRTLGYDKHVNNNTSR